MSIRYISQKIAQQVRYGQQATCPADPDQIDEELMSASGAFSLDQVGLSDQDAIQKSLKSEEYSSWSSPVFPALKLWPGPLPESLTVE